MIAGVIATFIHVACFYGARNIGISVPIANVIGFLIANVGSYVMASLFVFRLGRLKFKEYRKFVLLTYIGFLFVFFASRASVMMEWPDWVALLIVIICIPVINFNLLRFVIFRKSL